MNVVDFSKIVSEYDQEIPQSQTADKPMACYLIHVADQGLVVIG